MRIVVKIGSNILAGATGINSARIRSIARVVSALHDAGTEIVIVSRARSRLA